MTMSKTPVPNLLSKSHSVMYDEKHTLHTQSAISKIFDSVKTGTCIMYTTRSATRPAKNEGKK